MKKSLENVIKNTKTNFLKKIPNIAKKDFLGAIITLPMLLPFLAPKQAYAENVPSAVVKDNDIDNAENTDAFSEYYDFIGKLNAEFSDDYWGLGGMAKLSLGDTIGLALNYSTGQQDIEGFGNVPINKTGFRIGVYHPIEFDKAILNIGARISHGNQTFGKDYPIEEINASGWGAYAKLIAEDMKAFLSIDGTFANGGSYVYGGDNKGYSEYAINAAFKKYFGDVFAGVTLSLANEEFSGIGDSTKKIASLYGGVLDAGFFDKVLFGVYGGQEVDFSNEHDNMPLTAEVQLRKITGNHGMWGLNVSYNNETGPRAGIFFTTRYKDKIKPFGGQ